MQASAEKQRLSSQPDQGNVITDKSLFHLQMGLVGTTICPFVQ